MDQLFAPPGAGASLRSANFAIRPSTPLVPISWAKLLRDSLSTSQTPSDVDVVDLPAGRRLREPVVELDRIALPTDLAAHDDFGVLRGRPHRLQLHSLGLFTPASAPEYVRTRRIF